MTWIGVPAAAERLALTPARVRELISDGTIDAQKQGGAWQLHISEVSRLEQHLRPVGRPLNPEHAWGILALLEQRPLPTGIDRYARSRLRRRLRERPLGATVSRLHTRAARQQWHGPRDALSALIDQGDAVYGGIWTPHAEAHGLAADGPVELYLPEWAVGDLEDAGFETVAGGGNTLTHIVPRQLWPYRPTDRHVGAAVTGLDLIEGGEVGCQAVGWQLLGVARSQAPV